MSSKGARRLEELNIICWCILMQMAIFGQVSDQSKM